MTQNARTHEFQEVSFAQITSPHQWINVPAEKEIPLSVTSSFLALAAQLKRVGFVLPALSMTRQALNFTKMHKEVTNEQHRLGRHQVSSHH